MYKSRQKQLGQRCLYLSSCVEEKYIEKHCYLKFSLLYTMQYLKRSLHVVNDNLMHKANIC